MASTMRFDKWENPTGTRSLDIASATPGLTPIYPTSTTVGSGSASTNAIGTVTFTGVSSISLNGVFTSAYTNYRVLFNILSSTGTGGSVGIRLRNAGTDRNGTNYGTSGIQMNTAGSNSAYNAVTTFFDSGYLYIATSAYNSGTLEVKNPVASTIKTTMQCVQNGVTSAGVVASWVTNCLYDFADTNDGISILPTGAATITGTITVYGYNA